VNTAIAFFLVSSLAAAFICGAMAGFLFGVTSAPTQTHVVMIEPTPWPFPIAMKKCREQDFRVWNEISPLIGKQRVASK